MRKTRRDFMKEIFLSAGVFYSPLFNLNINNKSIIEMEEYMAYELPPLSYPYNALEPVIDEETMKLHHDKHHAAYVNGLNAAEQKLADARKTGDYALIKHYSKEIAFHGSGHILHSIFWKNLSPDGGGEPTGKLLDAIKKDFGSFEQFKAQMIAATNAVEGSGWGILAYQPDFDKLVILQAEKHQDLTQWGAYPIFVIDVWEHAYYLKYQNKRADFVNNIFNIVNWKDVTSRLERLKK
jgi:Fe-Mn family superoxide dismutase